MAVKGGFILLIALLGASGCRQASNNEVPPPNARSSADVWVNDTRTLDDGSVVTRTPAGTIIKKDGWKLPLPMPEKKKWHATTVVIDGQLVEVLNTPFFPAAKLMMKFPRHAQDGDAEYKVTQILELTNKSKKPYCYQFFGEDDVPTYSGVTNYRSYRDDDGDGIFETLGESCSVPAWVK